jgi:hypothetical protein
MTTLSSRLVLRDLPLPTRLALAAFLLAVGAGYFSALVQLHFQHASPGALLPTADDTAAAFHGRPGASQLERLLLADGGKPFNGSGSMRQAFTAKSAGWKNAVSRRAKEKDLDPVRAEEELRNERDGERLALLDWIRAGADRREFEEEGHPLPPRLADRPLTPEFLDNGPDGTARARVGLIVEARCARCHSDSGSSSAAKFPLETWEQVHEYCEPQATEGGMSLPKLAQTTHVHLLGLVPLLGLTGLIVTFTSYPGWLRAVLGVLPLAAQVADAGCWWLARADPFWAQAIMVTGGAVAVGLALQIGLSLFNLFGRGGKVLLVLALIAALLGGWALKERVIDPHLAQEKARAAAAE